jgi:hypothetical protein
MMKSSGSGDGGGDGEVRKRVVRLNWVRLGRSLVNTYVLKPSERIRELEGTGSYGAPIDRLTGQLRSKILDLDTDLHPDVPTPPPYTA